MFVSFTRSDAHEDGDRTTREVPEGFLLREGTGSVMYMVEDHVRSAQEMDLRRWIERRGINSRAVSLIAGLGQI